MNSSIAAGNDRHVLARRRLHAAGQVILIKIFKALALGRCFGSLRKLIL
jgi:hypothetical protein